MTGECPTPIGDIFRVKTTPRVGCWNVRTLYQTVKLEHVMTEMKSYKIEFLGISETRWTDLSVSEL